jgi:hypothetical protein
MEHAPNFTFVGAVTAARTTTHLMGQFEAPDREHLVLSAANGPSRELLFVGSKAYVRNPTGGWVDLLGGAPGSTDARAAFSTLMGATYSAATSVTASGQTQYACTLPARQASQLVRGVGARGEVSCSVTLGSGTISDLKLHGARFSADITYQDVGSTASIAGP